MISGQCSFWHIHQTAKWSKIKIHFIFHENFDVNKHPIYGYTGPDIYICIDIWHIKFVHVKMSFLFPIWRFFFFFSILLLDFSSIFAFSIMATSIPNVYRKSTQSHWEFLTKTTKTSLTKKSFSIHISYFLCAAISFHVCNLFCFDSTFFFSYLCCVFHSTIYWLLLLLLLV